MQQSEAIKFLSVPWKPHSGKEVWADFGCGTGTFTLALAQLLGPQSRIIAVDKDRNALEKIPDHFDQISLEKRCVDFTDREFSSNSLDGVLMANSLHYVRDQQSFVETAKHYLKPDGYFMIVEYNTNRSNPWVPYPLSFGRLQSLFKDAGFQSARKIKEKPSRFNRANLYSAIIQ